MTERTIKQQPSARSRSDSASEDPLVHSDPNKKSKRVPINRNRRSTGGDRRFTLERKLSEGEVIVVKNRERILISQNKTSNSHEEIRFHGSKKQSSKLASFFRRGFSTTHVSPLESEVEKKEREIIEKKYGSSKKKIILLQSFVRTMLIRRNFFVTTKHTISARRAMFKVLNTFCDVESRIVRVIKAICHSYAKPLSSRKTLISIPKAALQTLFFNTRTLLAYHQAIEKEFYNFRNCWPLTANIGNFLAVHLSQLSFLYTDYVNHLRKAEEVLDQYFNSTIGKLFLKNKSREHINDTGITSLKKLLSYPTLYLISYRNHCLDLLYAMGPFNQSKEYPFILHASCMAAQLQSTIERQINAQDMEILCEKLSKTLLPVSPTPNYKVEGRKFIREARVTWKERKKLRLFLFSDILLVTKPKGKKFSLLEEIPLCDISVSIPEFVSAYSLVYYRIVTPSKTYQLMERKSSGFISIFDEVISIATARALAKRDISHFSPGLSPFVLKTIYYIDKSRIKDGLFRASIKNFKNGLRLICDEGEFFFCFMCKVGIG